MGGLEAISERLFGESGTLTEAERMEKLARATKKTAEETEELNEYKKEQQRIESMMGLKSAEERGTAAAAQEAIGEADPGVILDKLIKARERDQRPLQSDMHLPGAIASARRRLAVAERVMRGGGTEEEMIGFGITGPEKEAARLRAEIKRLQDAVVAAKRKDAERIMLRGQEDPTALAAELQATDPELAAKIRRATPGARKAREEAEENNRRIDEQTDKMRKLGEENAKADAKRLGGMNEELEVMAEMAEFDASDMAKELSPKQVAEEAALLERGGDLAWRRMLMRMPTAKGGTLSLDAFEQATKGVGGVSEEVKQLRAIHEVDKEIAANTAKLDKLKPRKIAR